MLTADSGHQLYNSSLDVCASQAICDAALVAEWLEVEAPTVHTSAEETQLSEPSMAQAEPEALVQEALPASYYETIELYNNSLQLNPN